MDSGPPRRRDAGATRARLLKAARELFLSRGYTAIGLREVAANAGVRTATADVVELLNDDTEVTAGWAEAALAHFDDARVAAVAPLVLLGEPGRQELGAVCHAFAAHQGCRFLPAAGGAAQACHPSEARSLARSSDTRFRETHPCRQPCCRQGRAKFRKRPCKRR